MKNASKKIIVAMSGGVDSSVAAKLLTGKKTQAVMGVFLHFWKDPKTKVGQAIENKCCSAKALFDARAVCRQLGIKLYTMNFSQEFKKEIVDDFLSEYAIGNTPNPCVRCNKFVKLGRLIIKARELGFAYVASGHYARLKQENNKYKLYKAKDREKDQSYFLYRLSQKELKHLLFPLGEYTKPEIRKIAAQNNFSVAEKKDSTEVCFIPGKNHNDFLRNYLALQPGPIMLWHEEKNGRREEEKIGQHQGLPLYTIGQRRGIEIGGTGPYYAAQMDYEKNALYVVRDADDEILFSDSMLVKNVNWISGDMPQLPLDCEVVIRYRHKPIKCRVKELQVESAKVYKVVFEKPVRAITPGQSAVFYQGEEVLGGGIIG